MIVHRGAAFRSTRAGAYSNAHSVAGTLERPGSARGVAACAGCCTRHLVLLMAAGSGVDLRVRAALPGAVSRDAADSL